MIARRVSFVLPLLLGVACKPSQPAPSLERVQAFEVKGGVERLVGDLDATGDGRVDAADWSFFDQLTNAARATLEKNGTSVGPRVKLYVGPPEKSAPVFSLVGLQNGKPDLSQVPADRLEELWVESRWAGQQSRIASLAPGGLDRAFHGVVQGQVAGFNPAAMEPAAVCAAIDSFDLAPYQKLGLPVAAVFDLDSTVWAGNVTDVFLAMLADRKLPLPQTNAPLQEFLKTVPGVDPKVVETNDVNQNAALLFKHHTDHSLPKEQQVSAKDAFYNIVKMLAGRTRAEVVPVARAAFHEGALGLPPWKQRVFADPSGCGMRQVIERLAKRGVEIYLLSATLDILAEEGGVLFGVPRERVLGSVLAVEDGRYTGEVADSTYYTKGPIVRQWLVAPPVFVFGDSPSSDFGMLAEAAGASFVVNPRPRWKTIDEEQAGSRLVSLAYPKTVGELSAPGR